MQQETLQRSNEQYTSLQAARELMAVRESQGQQHRLLQSLDRISNPQTIVSEIKPGETFDAGMMSASEYMTLEAVGIDRAAYVEKAAQTPALEPVTMVTVGDETLTVSRYSKWGLSAHLSGDIVRTRQTNPPSPVGPLAKERFRQSPAHAAINKLTAELGDGPWPSSASTEPFSANTDPLGTLTFLLDCLPYNSEHYSKEIVAMRLASGENPQKLVDGIIDTTFKPASNPSAEILTHTWGEGVEQTLTYTPHDARLSYSTRQEPIDNYNEKANNNRDQEFEQNAMVILPCCIR